MIERIPSIDDTIVSSPKKEGGAEKPTSIEAVLRRELPDRNDAVWIGRSGGRVQEATAYSVDVEKKQITVRWQEDASNTGSKTQRAENVIFLGREFAEDDPRTGNRGGIVQSVEFRDGEFSAHVLSEKEPYTRPLATLLAPLEAKKESTIEKPKITAEQQELLDELWPQGLAWRIEQGFAGDCYYLAGLNAIKNPDDAAESLLRLVSKNKENDTFNVRFPGDKVKRRDFLITRSNVKEMGELGANASLGDLILERAYGRLRDKRAKNADDGFASAQTYYGKKADELAINEGDPLTALEDLLGDTHEYSHVYKNGIISISRFLTANHESDPNFIQSGNKKITLTIEGTTDTENLQTVDAAGNPIELPKHHAYTVISMPLNGREVVIENPHGTRHVLTVKQCEEIFDYMGIATKKSPKGA